MARTGGFAWSGPGVLKTVSVGSMFMGSSWLRGRGEVVGSWMPGWDMVARMLECVRLIARFVGFGGAVVGGGGEVGVICGIGEGCDAFGWIEGCDALGQGCLMGMVSGVWGDCFRAECLMGEDGEWLKRLILNYLTLKGRF